jgi:hypothetical protein
MLRIHCLAPAPDLRESDFPAPDSLQLQSRPSTHRHRLSLLALAGASYLHFVETL